MLSSLPDLEAGVPKAMLESASWTASGEVGLGLARRELVWLDYFGAAEIAGDVAHVVTLLLQVETLLFDERLLVLLLLELLLMLLLLRRLWRAEVRQPVLLRRIVVVHGAAERLRLRLSRKRCGRGGVEARGALTEGIGLRRCLLTKVLRL